MKTKSNVSTKEKALICERILNYRFEDISKKLTFKQKELARTLFRQEEHGTQGRQLLFSDSFDLEKDMGYFLFLRRVKELLHEKQKIRAMEYERKHEQRIYFDHAAKCEIITRTKRPIFYLDSVAVYGTIEAYKRFLILCLYSKTPLSPPEPIDIAWHTHILFQESYNFFQKKVVGFPLLHKPNPFSGKGEFKDFPALIKKYWDVFRDSPNSEFWTGNDSELEHAFQNATNERSSKITRRSKRTRNIRCESRCNECSD